jgi:hypothetical protein
VNFSPTSTSLCRCLRNYPSWQGIYGGEQSCARPAAAILASPVVEKLIVHPVRMSIPIVEIYDG